MKNSLIQDSKLDVAIGALFSALTTVWEDNGNIMAEAVRDNVMTIVSQITGMSFKQVEKKIEQMVEEMQ